MAGQYYTTEDCFELVAQISRSELLAILDDGGMAVRSHTAFESQFELTRRAAPGLGRLVGTRLPCVAGVRQRVDLPLYAAGYTTKPLR